MNLVTDTSFQSTVSASPRTCRVVRPMGTTHYPHMDARDKKMAIKQAGYRWSWKSGYQPSERIWKWLCWQQTEWEIWRRSWRQISKKITLLYSGRVLDNNTLIKDLDIPKGFVIQAVVTWSLVHCNNDCTKPIASFQPPYQLGLEWLGNFHSWLIGS